MISMMTTAHDALWFGDPNDQAAFRHAAIAKAAYFRAQERGFAPGHELEDWLAAEREVYALPAHGGWASHPAMPPTTGRRAASRPKGARRT